MNPVELELVKLKYRWKKELLQSQSSPMIICRGEKHETDIFDGFMKSRMAEENEDEDIYLIHYQNFEGKNSFGEHLWEEWSQVYQAFKEDQQSEFTLPNWALKKEEAYATDAYKALLPLIHLQEHFPELQASYIFLYIAPLRISDLSELAQWVDDWCHLCKKFEIEHIKLVWSEHHTFKTLPSTSFAHSFRLAIDVHELMENTAAHTNRTKNSVDTDFQQQILSASNHLSKKRFREAELSLGKAIKLSSELNNKEAGIAAYSLLAQAHVAQRKKDKAEDVYQKIFREVEKGSALEIQMYMNYGGFLLGEGHKGKAEGSFLQAADLAKARGDYAIALECYRTVGILYDSLLSRSRMLEMYQQSLEMGRLMSSQQRQESSLRYIGSVLSEKYSGKQYWDLEQEMHSYFGDAWKVSTKRPKTPSII